MGRKSSAKLGRESTTQVPPETGKRSRLSTPLIAVSIVAVALAGFVYLGSRGNAQPEADAAARRPSESSPLSDQPRFAKLGPHKQAAYPPLPTQPFEPPRPADVVRSAYLFAAEHPEILSYVPCFCGCERGGHKGNEDCFVAARSSNGDVTAWEPHGLDCAVCIDVATEARMLFNAGASVRDIRASVEKRFAGMNGGHTPTPQPPTSSE